MRHRKWFLRWREPAVIFWQVARRAYLEEILYSHQHVVKLLVRP